MTQVKNDNGKNKKPPFKTAQDFVDFQNLSSNLENALRHIAERFPGLVEPFLTKMHTDFMIWHHYGQEALGKAYQADAEVWNSIIKENEGSDRLLLPQLNEA